VIRRYHDGTKHFFDRFARSLGYLDWANQPNPFRSFQNARQFPLPPQPSAVALSSPVGDILRYSLGLTAWKSSGASRWPLRANPSSGNLHPTEAYVVCSAESGPVQTSAVYHYAPDRHVLEQRCAFVSDVLAGDVLLIGLTSIHWREAWKYGERAFRYCQHDLGHALAAVSFAAALVGWRAALQCEWSHDDLASLTGVDRDSDYVDAEREEPGALLLLTPAAGGRVGPVDRRRLLADISAGEWTGRANQLSEDHVQWTFIDEAAAATRWDHAAVSSALDCPASPALSVAPASPAPPVTPSFPARIIMQRRSAVALDARSSWSRERFNAMLARVLPGDAAPWHVLWWSPFVHLALFVHRVDDLEPGLYLFLREPGSGDRLLAALGRTFSAERVIPGLPLVRLASGDCRALARRVSCDQDIAADGFFSLGMIAEFDAALAMYGEAFYRNLFWETGVIGQALYLEAEAAGVRGTGIGCFYDDAVHHVLGLTGHTFQSLYHFTIGIPVEDSRLTTSPGYAWEQTGSPLLHAGTSDRPSNRG
jgi:SagB-type dehydrogenase family enzyme